MMMRVARIAARILTVAGLLVASLFVTAAYTPSTELITTVDNNALLKALPAGVYTTVYRRGFATNGDGGASLYQWSGTNCSQADNGAQSSPNAGTGCWVANFNGLERNALVWGTKCDAATNDTTAIESAISAVFAEGGGTLNLPSGTCLVNLSITNAANVAQVSLVGAGKAATVLSPYSTTADTVNFSNESHWINIEHLSIRGTDTGTASGLVFNTSSNNKVNDIVVENFKENGIACIGGGSSGGPSGNDIKNSYVLVPADGSRGIYWSGCNDSHLINNQIGVTSAVGAGNSAAIGVQFTNYSGGNQFDDNFVWQQNTSIQFDTESNLNWVSRNRFTQNLNTALVLNGVEVITACENQFYGNGNQTNNTYPDVFVSGASHHIKLCDNEFAIAPFANIPSYNIELGTGVSHIQITGNDFIGSYATAPTNQAANLTDIVLSGNTPTGSALTNNTVVAMLSGGTTTSFGGSGATDYLGAAGGNITDGSSEFSVPPTLTATSGAAGVSGYLVRCFQVSTQFAPGAGQSYTYTLRHNLSSTGITATQSGASAFTAQVCVDGPSAIYVQPGDQLDIELVSSGGAAAGTFFYTIPLQQ